MRVSIFSRLVGRLFTRCLLHIFLPFLKLGCCLIILKNFFSTCIQVICQTYLLSFCQIYIYWECCLSVPLSLSSRHPVRAELSISKKVCSISLGGGVWFGLCLLSKKFLHQTHNTFLFYFVCLITLNLWSILVNFRVWYVVHFLPWGYTAPSLKLLFVKWTIYAGVSFMSVPSTHISAPLPCPECWSYVARR